MNSICRLVRSLFNRKAKKKVREQPVSANPDTEPAENAGNPRRDVLPDDDSPPGYKIRWHH